MDFCVEDTHDRLLAVGVGQRGHAQVELAALHGAADAAVLGERRSEMSRLAMILRRLVMAADMLAGGFIISKSSPSMRKRTLSFFSAGSMWISEAPSLTAFWMM
jgi:hypothetical protein